MPGLESYIGRPCYALGRFGYIRVISDEEVTVGLFERLPPAYGRPEPGTWNETASLDEVHLLDGRWAFHCASELRTLSLNAVVAQFRVNATRHLHGTLNLRLSRYRGPRCDGRLDISAIVSRIRADLKTAVGDGEIPNFGFTVSGRAGSVKIRTAEYRRFDRDRLGVTPDPERSLVCGCRPDVLRRVLMIAYAYGCGDADGGNYTVHADDYLHLGSDIYGPSREERARLKAECETACREIKERHPYPTLAELIGGAANVA